MCETAARLITKVQQGDQDAFRHLVSPYRNRAFGLCYSITGNVEDAKDILQEALIKAYRNIGRFREESSFYSWFYAIVANTARDFLRKMTRIRTEPTSGTVKHPLSSVGEIQKSEMKRLLDAAVRRLPERQYMCFVMKHMNDMKINEIAGVMNCTPSTVKAHLFKAVRNLQSKLASYITADI